MRVLVVGGSGSGKSAYAERLAARLAEQRTYVATMRNEGTKQAIMRKREFEAFEAECLSCLSDEEQVQLLGMLDRLVEHWRGLDRKEACA